MATTSKKQDFFETAEGIEIKEMLINMTTSSQYATGSSYSPNTVEYENNRVPFIDKHMAFIRKNPQINPLHYIANLKILTRLQ